MPLFHRASTTKIPEEQHIAAAPSIAPNGEPTVPTVEDFLPYFAGRRKGAEYARDALLEEVKAGYIDYYREPDTRQWVIERAAPLHGHMTLEAWVNEWDCRRPVRTDGPDLKPGDAAMWRWWRAEDACVREAYPEYCHSYRVTVIGPSTVAPGLIDCRNDADGRVFQASPRELTPIASDDEPEGGAA